jgi:hypothetical protein
MRLNGWQRIGIVASVIWAIGASHPVHPRGRAAMKLCHFVLAIIALFQSTTEALAGRGYSGSPSGWALLLFVIPVVVVFGLLGLMDYWDQEQEKKRKREDERR